MTYTFFMLNVQIPVVLKLICYPNLASWFLIVLERGYLQRDQYFHLLILRGEREKERKSMDWVI